MLILFHIRRVSVSVKAFPISNKIRDKVWKCKPNILPPNMEDWSRLVVLWPHSWIAFLYLWQKQSADKERPLTSSTSYLIFFISRSWQTENFKWKHFRNVSACWGKHFNFTAPAFNPFQGSLKAEPSCAMVLVVIQVSAFMLRSASDTTHKCEIAQMANIFLSLNTLSGFQPFQIFLCVKLLPCDP